MGITVFDLDSVNRCQVAEMEKAAKELDLQNPGSCEVFAKVVRNVQAAVIHTYRSEAEKRYHQNLQDSECAKTPAPSLTSWVRRAGPLTQE